jgi:hypothetical protein
MSIIVPLPSDMINLMASRIHNEDQGASLGHGPGDDRFGNTDRQT